MQSVFRKLLTAILFITIVQAIAPEGRFRKYVTLAVYLSVAAAVAAPIFSALSEEIYLRDEALFFAFDETAFSDTLNSESNSYDSAIAAAYAAKLDEALLQKLYDEGFSCVTRTETVTGTFGGAAGFGDIKAVYITADGECDENLLKKTVNDFYNLDEANIYIVR